MAITHRIKLNEQAYPSLSKSITRVLLLFIGSISLVLGVIGIFLPLLPTTPFLLLSAGCFARSSKRFYSWLVSHPILSKYILAYLNGEGIPRKAKIYTLCTLWLTMGISLAIIPLWPVCLLLFLIGASVSAYIWRLPEAAL